MYNSMCTFNYTTFVIFWFTFPHIQLPEPFPHYANLSTLKTMRKDPECQHLNLCKRIGSSEIICVLEKVKMVIFAISIIFKEM